MFYSILFYSHLDADGRSVHLILTHKDFQTSRANISEVALSKNVQRIISARWRLKSGLLLGLAHPKDEFKTCSNHKWFHLTGIPAPDLVPVAPASAFLDKPPMPTS